MAGGQPERGGIGPLADRWDQLIRAVSDDPPATYLKPPATEADVAALEARIGATLPPSYRAFLAVTNGADAMPGWGAVAGEPDSAASTGLRDTAHVDWIRNGDHGLVSIWSETHEGLMTVPADRNPAFVPFDSEREYLRGGPEVIGGEKPGHLRYVLEISSSVDGWATYLNPLVVDADGEWEAWDFGTKNPGAIRHRSFRALLEADVDGLEHRKAANDRADAEVDRHRRDLADPSRTPEEQVSTARELFWRGSDRPTVVAPMAAIALDPSVDTTLRQTAIQLLGYTQEPQAIETLVTLALDPEPRIRASVIGPLVAAPGPRATAAARAMLTDAATPDFAFGFVYACSGAVFPAWQDTRDRRLLALLARCGDRRVIEPLTAAIVDPETADHERSHLISQVGMHLRDPELASALVTAAALQTAHARVHTAQTLERMGASGEAIAMLRDTAIELGAEGRGQAEAALGSMKGDGAAEALFSLVRTHPTPAGVAALGWHPSATAAAAIEALADASDLGLPAADALETMASSEAVEVLARRSAAGDRLATRALARMRDPRAFEPLLADLANADTEMALNGADGLRDLRDPRATEALLARAEDPDPDLAVVATHALVSMASPRIPDALDRLATHEDDKARALAARWREAWERRA